MIIHRRSFLRGLFAAPAIVTAANLMPIRGERLLMYGGLDLNTGGFTFVKIHYDPPWISHDHRFKMWRDDPFVHALIGFPESQKWNNDRTDT